MLLRELLVSAVSAEKQKEMQDYFQSVQQETGVLKELIGALAPDDPFFAMQDAHAHLARDRDADEFASLRSSSAILSSPASGSASAGGAGPGSGPGASLSAFQQQQLQQQISAAQRAERAEEERQRKARETVTSLLESVLGSQKEAVLKDVEAYFAKKKKQEDADLKRLQMVESDLLDNEDKVKLHVEDMELAVQEGKKLSGQMLNGNIERLQALFKRVRAELEAQIAGNGEWRLWRRAERPRAGRDAWAAGCAALCSALL